MKFLFSLAYKNLYRHKLRTLVSIIAIAFAVAIVVFARGYIVGLIDSVSADQIQFDSGHIKILDRNYYQQQRLLPLNYPVDGFDGQDLGEMMAALQKIENVEMIIPRLKFAAAASTDDDLVAMNGWGVDPDKEIEFTNVEQYLVEGRMVEPGKNEVVMGTALLNKLDRQVGEKITLLYNTSYNSLKGTTFTITGRLESGMKMLNEVVFYLPLTQAQNLLYMEDQVTELLLAAPHRRYVPEIMPEVESLLDAQNAADRYLAISYDEDSELIPYLDLARIIYNQVYIFLVLLASIVVINTMIMIVKERTREIGMMSAMGLESRRILKLFIMEGAIMGIIGSLIGAVTGGILNAYLARIGINFSSATAGFSSEVIFNSIIYPVSSLRNVIFAFVLGVIVVTVACIIPARRAARLNPTEAMREVG
ncbi:MAG: ABC transporter permease [Halanaerobiales bacterium]